MLAGVCLWACAASCAQPPNGGSLSWGGQTRAPAGSGVDAGRDVRGTGGSGGFSGVGGSGGSSGFDAGRDSGTAFDVPGEALADVVGPPDVRPYVSGLMGCHLDIDVTTDSLNLDYAPNHIAAIWIANGAGRFIKSIAVWANRRISHLPKWIAATNAAGVRQNRVDAVTGPTLYFHGRRTVAWNCTGVDRQKVADGPYQVCFELNETNGTSEFECVPFTKGTMADTVKPEDNPSFRYRTLNFFPQ